jgi:molybdate transport system ATP-binding protein
LFGSSGAGKSATLSAIAGALKPDSGRIAIAGRVLYDKAACVDLAPERRGIGWVFQDARLFPHLSVERNLRYGMVRRRERPARIPFDAVVEVLGIERLLQRRPRDLSGGEAQRAALGRALLAQPELLLMDEPLAALDTARKNEILAFIETAQRTFAIPTFYVTHSMAETVRLADRLVVFDQGRVLAEGPLAEIMARTDLPALSERADAATLIEGVVAAHDADRGLTLVQAGEAVWTCQRLPKPVGAAVRLVVPAREVMLAVAEPYGLSARNVLPARIETLTPRQDGTVMARLNVAGRPVLSALTLDAVKTLALRPDASVWAVIKSVALEGDGRGGLLPIFEN